MSNVKHSTSAEKFRTVNNLLKENLFSQAEAFSADWRNQEFNNSEAWRASSLVYLAKKEVPEALMCVDFAERCCAAYDPNPQILKAKIYTDNKAYNKANQIYDKMLKEYDQPQLINIYTSVLVLKADLSTKINPSETAMYLENIKSLLDNRPVTLSPYYKNKLAFLQEQNNKKQFKI